jgi:hypothetical protein
MAVPRPVRAETSGALSLGVLGLVGLYFPVGGVVFGAVGAILGIRALRMNRDSGAAVFALSLAATDIALSVSGFIWSVMTGLMGIVTSPAPP